jgi:methanogenic corrinoid protein MtbC1
LQPLLAGRRGECFQIVDFAIQQGVPAEQLLLEIVWPAMTQVARLFREDRINTATQQMSTLINRCNADRIQAYLKQASANGRRVCIVSAKSDAEELGAQIITDLLQAAGWETYFVGGGVPHDEILALIGNIRPDALIVYGTLPPAVPETRELIDLIRGVGSCPAMNVVVSGGVFNRADGLWQEVGADVFCADAAEILQRIDAFPPRQPNAPRVAIVKKRKRRRKAAAPA